MPMTNEMPELGRFAEPSLYILVSLSDGPEARLRDHGRRREDLRRTARARDLYGALARLEARGLIEALEPEERRRPYRLTGLGATALRAQLEQMRGFTGRRSSDSAARAPEDSAMVRALPLARPLDTHRGPDPRRDAVPPGGGLSRRRLMRARSARAGLRRRVARRDAGVRLVGSGRRRCQGPGRHARRSRRREPGAADPRRFPGVRAGGPRLRRARRPGVGELAGRNRPTGDGSALNVRALSQRCPHLGCRPNPCVEDFWFHCPCHQSRYDRLGIKAAGELFGPAPRGMDRFAIEVDAIRHPHDRHGDDRPRAAAGRTGFAGPDPAAGRTWLCLSGRRAGDRQGAAAAAG